MRCRDLNGIPDREVCCFMISCKNSSNIDTVIGWLVNHSKVKNWGSAVHHFFFWGRYHSLDVESLILAWLARFIMSDRFVSSRDWFDISSLFLGGYPGWWLPTPIGMQIFEPELMACITFYYVLLYPIDLVVHVILLHKTWWCWYILRELQLLCLGIPIQYIFTHLKRKKSKTEGQLMVF